MKILAFSDIHDNLACVRKLCAHLQPTDYDLVVVAGDIGDEIIGEFFSLMRKFTCPIYYVYGNWDYQQDYYKIFSDNAVHIHHRIMNMDGYFFVGFSGCEANWGENPIKQRLYCEMDEKHDRILTRLNVVKSGIEIEASDIKSKYANEIKSARLNARDNNSKSHKTKIERLKRRRNDDINALQSRLKDITTTDDYSDYEYDKYSIHKEIFRQNKIELARLVKEAGIDHKKLVVVTHDRIYKLTEYFGNPPFMHLFGHRHGHKYTFHNQTHNVNVSVLDRTSLVVPNDYQNVNCHHRDIRRAITGTYCIIDLEDDGSFDIAVKELRYDTKKWKPIIHEWFEDLDEIDFEMANDMCTHIAEDEEYLATE
ncbi:MAG: metallophosphoesterase family protein [Candidatus Thiodiazotropha taylori]|nr:metallophosphoesterase family protein [Candidatus Thiodiazotropha endolucinida]MCW4229120.1 metallophosphoesterase family protein [Candidatus Thiodiazotropha taylori]